MTYRVVDTRINKLFGAYETEEEALTFVRALVGANGDDYAGDLAVSHERMDGSFGESLSGAALVARAEAIAAERTAAPGRRRTQASLTPGAARPRGGGPGAEVRGAKPRAHPTKPAEAG
jgi:hypothetical protein